jgi:hypothetical protein
MARKFSRLTRAATKQLLPGSTISEHSITFAHDAKGDGVFTIYILVADARIHRVVGRESDGTTRTHAQQFIEEQRSNARDDRLSLLKRRKLHMALRLAATSGSKGLMVRTCK